MSDLRNRTGAKFSWIALEQLEPPGSTKAEPEAVVEAANPGSTWGWPQIAGPSGPLQTEVERDRDETAAAPARKEAAEAGGVALTREHLEHWIDQLRASRPVAHAPGAAVREEGEPKGGPPRRVPAGDILFVGRRAAGPSEGEDRAIAARFPSIRGDRSNVSAGFGESAWHPGSPRRIAVLSVVLAMMLIWAAHTNHLFPYPVIEVPTTLNNLSRIT